MLGTQNMARVAFGFDLRCGMIPVSEIRHHNCDVLVARFRISKFYTQAVFTGGGINKADELIKIKEGEKYLVKSENQAIQADFTGLECRWDRVAQQNKIITCLLVKARSPHQEKALSIYADIIQKIEDGIEDEHLVTRQSMKFSYNPRWLRNEARSRTFGKSFLTRMLYYLELYYRNATGAFLMKFGMRTGETNWGDYKKQFIVNTDYRKLDDMLRVVISGTKGEKKFLFNYLDKMEEEGEIVYGSHSSEAAIVTCMVKKYNGFHFHFVDGDEGGYAMAAENLRSKELNHSR